MFDYFLDSSEKKYLFGLDLWWMLVFVTGVGIMLVMLIIICLVCVFCCQKKRKKARGTFTVNCFKNFMQFFNSQNFSFIHMKLIDSCMCCECLCLCLEEEYRLAGLVSSDQSDEKTERSERLSKSQRPLPPVPSPRSPPSPPYM